MPLMQTSLICPVSTPPTSDSILSNQKMEKKRKNTRLPASKAVTSITIPNKIQPFALALDSLLKTSQQSLIPVVIIFARHLQWFPLHWSKNGKLPPSMSLVPNSSTQVKLLKIAYLTQQEMRSQVCVKHSDIVYLNDMLTSGFKKMPRRGCHVGHLQRLRLLVKIYLLPAHLLLSCLLAPLMVL